MIDRWQCPFVFCDSASASILAFKDQKLAVWFHIDRNSEPDLSSLVQQFASNGAVHFAVSGANSPDLHDKIDDVLLDSGITSIVTTWHEEPLDEVAWDFANIDFCSARASIRCVVVFGNSLEAELAIISRLAKHISASRTN